MEIRTLGRSGLRVPAFGFGAMTFGGEGRFSRIGTTGVEEARRIVGLCLDAGVDFFDTADVYSFGKSEEILGQALGAKRKDAIVATKAFLAMGSGDNNKGASRRHLVAACDASLKRLGTDWVDLYQLHHYDGLTPLEETVAALDTLVRAGKVRYVGCSNYAGWQLMKALAVADRQGASRYISQQIYYSLLAREAENELVPLGLEEGVGILIWGPLAWGLLSGKFRRGQPLPEGARGGAGGPNKPDMEHLHAIVDVAAGIAASRNASVAQVALNWLAAKPGVTTVLIGARDEAQLTDNLAATKWQLNAEETARLDTVSRPLRPYPYWVQKTYCSDRNPYARGLDA